MHGVRVGSHGLAPCGARQASIEVPFRALRGKERQRRRCRVPCLHLFSGLDRRHVVAREEARLEFSDPVETFQEDTSGLTRDALLEGALREFSVIKGTEFLGSSAEGPGERERRGNSVEEEPEPPHELESVLGLTFELVEWMTQGKKNGTESAEGV